MSGRFIDGQAHAFRRFIRAAIKSGCFTKSERDVTLAIVNLWFHHKNGPEGLIRPGRAALAKKADVSERTVTTTLTMLREAGVLAPVAYLKGGRNATRYRVRFIPLLMLCGCDLPDWMDGDLVPVNRAETAQNFSVSDPKIAPRNRAKIAHGYKSNVRTFPSQRSDVQPTHRGGRA